MPGILLIKWLEMFMPTSWTKTGNKTQSFLKRHFIRSICPWIRNSIQMSQLQKKNRTRWNPGEVKAFVRSMSIITTYIHVPLQHLFTACFRCDTKQKAAFFTWFLLATQFFNIICNISGQAGHTLPADASMHCCESYNSFVPPYPYL